MCWPQRVKKVPSAHFATEGRWAFSLVRKLTVSENARNELLRNSPRPPGKAVRYDFSQRAVPSETPL